MSDQNAKEVVREITFPVDDINRRLQALEASEATSTFVAVSTTEVTINNSAVETTLVTYAVPAYTLVAHTMYVVRIWYRFIQNGVVARTIAWRLKYGATTLFTLTSTTLNTITGASELCAMLKYNGAANAQRGVLYDQLASATTDISGRGTTGTSAEDSATDLNLVVTAQLSAANANFGLYMLGYSVARVK